MGMQSFFDELTEVMISCEKKDIDMWDRDYRDYKRDEPLVKEPVMPGKGLIGCEMHDLNGWGNTLQHPKKKKRGFFGSLLVSWFGPKKEKQ